MPLAQYLDLCLYLANIKPVWVRFVWVEMQHTKTINVSPPGIPCLAEVSFPLWWEWKKETSAKSHFPFPSIHQHPSKSVDRKISRSFGVRWHQLAHADRKKKPLPSRVHLESYNCLISLWHHDLFSWIRTYVKCYRAQSYYILQVT